MSITWKDIQKSYTTGKLPLTTGFFRIVNSYLDMGYKPIAICGKSPDWYKGLEYKRLAPKISFFMEWKKGKINNDQYIEQYHKQVLNQLEPKTILQEIHELSNSPKIVLLCYEKFGDFCHRHIVAHWLKNSGYNVCELDANKELFNGLFSR